MAYRTKSDELRKLAKAANERMRQMERQGIKSPAYEAAQARLEAAGVRKTAAGGRRFSETGMGTYNQRERMEKIIKQFLNARTGTIRGTKSLQDQIWNTANADGRLSEAGVTKEQYFEIWKNLPSRKTDRIYGSKEVVRIVKAVSIKAKKSKKEDAVDISEIVNEITASGSLKDAFKKVGITSRDYYAVARLEK